MKFKFFKRAKKEKRSKRSSVTFSLSGYNFERWLNVLSNKGVEIYSAEKLDVKNSRLEVGIENEKAVENFLKSKNFSVSKKEYNGLARPLKFFSVRFGIIIGVFLCFCFYVVASNYVWRIEVFGNERVDSNEIESVLNENGVSIFSPLNSKTNEQIENIILENFNDVSMVSVVKKGTSIIINLKEKLISDEIDDEFKVGAILAGEDGTIKNIKLIQGTLLVKAGDKVRAGDALVAPYIVDSSGKQIPTQPKAEITFEFLLAGQSEHKEYSKTEVRTGRSVSERIMSFLDKEIVTTKAEIPFEKYEAERNETYLSNSVLPLKYIILTYYELEEVTLTQNFSEVKNQKIEEAKKLAMARKKEDDNVVYENFVITEKDGRTIVDYVICVERIVSF